MSKFWKGTFYRLYFLKENAERVSNDGIDAHISKEASEMLDKDYQTSIKLAELLQIKDKLADISLKKIYGYFILGILALWVIVVAFICITYIFQDKPNMSDGVLITLLTTTTANILVLPTVVVKYLFPNKK